MDSEALIAAVFKQTPIWDKCNKYHSNRTFIEQCWKSVSEELNIEDIYSLRKKWKYLRDQFSVELGKLKAPSHESKWLYFNMLLFLKDTVKPRHIPSKGHSSKAADESVSSENEFFDMDEITTKQMALEYDDTLVKMENELDDDPQTSNDFTPHSDSNIPPKRKREDDDNDEDMLFFKSLLPHVCKIPPNLKLTFRSRVQDIVNDFAYIQAPSVP